MLDKNELKTIDGDIYNELSRRNICVKTMWYFPNKTVMKILLAIPIWNGVIFVEVSQDHSDIKIMHRYFFRKKKVLTKININESKYGSIETVVDDICSRIAALSKNFEQ